MFELPLSAIFVSTPLDPGLLGCCGNGNSKLKTPPVASGGALAGVRVPLSVRDSKHESASSC